MIFEQDDSYLEATRTGSFFEFEFWSRGRHRGFVQIRASQIHPTSVGSGDLFDQDGLHIRPADEGGWVVEYAAKNFQKTFHLSKEEVRQVFFADGEPS